MHGQKSIKIYEASYFTIIILHIEKLQFCILHYTFAAL